MENVCPRGVYLRMDIYLTEAEKARFWDKVDKTPGHGPHGECWIWTASFFHARDNNYHYGQFRVGGRGGRPWGAHRISLALKLNVPINFNGVACHRCDYPSCVRPKHLWLGSHADNMHDAKIKLRMGNGMGSGTRKLTPMEAAYVKWAPIESLGFAAMLLGISKPTARAARVGETWEWLTPELFIQSFLDEAAALGIT